jgi:probable HAF family extracellular repeat protein
MVDLGSLGGGWSYARAVNAGGRVVGYSFTSGNEWHAYSWMKASGMVDLGALGGYMSVASGLNMRGQVVGYAFPVDGHDHAVLWNPTDTTPPTLTVSASPNLLWPPNHKFVTVQATVTATDGTDPNPTIELVSVTDNEPGDSSGDGNTVNHIVINPAALHPYPDTFQLVAERSALGTGRIYTITYRATDANGNSTTASATVTVPLSN